MTVTKTFTFEQLVEHGRNSGCPLYGALYGDKQMPWSFTVDGHQVTHETDECYIICGPAHKAPEYGHFVPGDLLVIEDGVARIAREKQ